MNKEKRRKIIITVVSHAQVKKSVMKAAVIQMKGYVIKRVEATVARENPLKSCNLLMIIW